MALEAGSQQLTVFSENLSSGLLLARFLVLGGIVPICQKKKKTPNVFWKKNREVVKGRQRKNDS